MDEEAASRPVRASGDDLTLRLLAPFDRPAAEPPPPCLIDLMNLLDEAERRKVSSQFKQDLIAALPALRGYARTIERDLARADDLVQETSLRAWTHRDSFDDGGNMKAWLFTILRNAARSQMRKSSREVEDVDGAYAGRVATRGDQEGHLEFLELEIALAKLPADQREAIILVCAGGVTYEEAASMTGATEGALKTRVSRARATLIKLTGFDPTLAPGAA